MYNNYNFLRKSMMDRSRDKNSMFFDDSMSGVLNNGLDVIDSQSFGFGINNNGMNSSVPNGINNGMNSNNQGMNSSNSDNQMMNSNGSNNQSLVSPSEGYIRGNLFANLYSQYKSYKPSNLSQSNAREKLFNEMSENAFAAHELNLYLDLNPGDNSMITLFNDYRDKADKLKQQYEEMYGPISINSSVLNNTPFLWSVLKWPWEGGE